MNKDRRARLNAIINAITEQKDDLECVHDEEEEAMDNVPESLHETERYQAMEEAVSAMSDALDSLNEAIDYLEGVF